jgi:hypothetical protein
MAYRASSRSGPETLIVALSWRRSFVAKKIRPGKDEYFRVVRHVFGFLVEDFGYHLAEEEIIAYEQWTAYERGNQGVRIVKQGNCQPMAELYAKRPDGEKTYRQLYALTADDLTGYYEWKDMDRSSHAAYRADLQKHAELSARLLRRYAGPYLSGRQEVD